MPMAPILRSPCWVVLLASRATLSKGLPCADAPDAGEAADAAGGDAVDAAETDEGFFHQADEVDWAETAAAGVSQAAEVEDGIADELAGAVIGDVAAAVDFVEGDAAAGKQLVGGQNVGAVGVAAKGEDGRMLEEQEHVFDAALEAEVDYFRLQARASS